MPDEALPHLFVEGRFQPERYITPRPSSRRMFDLPPRDRWVHAATIREQLNQAREENERRRGVTASPEVAVPIILEIRSEPHFRLKLESLEDRRKAIEVACVRKEGDVQVATVHVPEGSLVHFSKRIDKYQTENTKDRRINDCRTLGTNTSGASMIAEHGRRHLLMRWSQGVEEVAASSEKPRTDRTKCPVGSCDTPFVLDRRVRVPAE